MWGSHGQLDDRPTKTQMTIGDHLVGWATSVVVNSSSWKRVFPLPLIWLKHFGDIIPQERNPAAQEMRRPAEARPFKGAPSKLPSMQFFGPSDFVPELPHNVQVETPQAICKHFARIRLFLQNCWHVPGQGGVVRLQGGNRRVGSFPPRSRYKPEQGLPAVQKLEPKPRWTSSTPNTCSQNYL